MLLPGSAHHLKSFHFISVLLDELSPRALRTLTAPKAGGGKTLKDPERISEAYLFKIRCVYS